MSPRDPGVPERPSIITNPSASAPRLIANGLAIAFVAIALASAVPQHLAAAESSRMAEDLQVTVNADWGGCRSGGYFPIRVKLVNRATDRNVELRFVPSMQGNESAVAVRTELTIPASSSATTVLLVPMVTRYAWGTLEVRINGRFAPDLNTPVSAPELSDLSIQFDGLMVSNGKLETSELAKALFRLSPSGTSGSGYGAYSAYRTADTVPTTEPASLPDAWLAYTGLDLLFMNQSDFAALPSRTKVAIGDWVATGGTLVLAGIDPALSAGAKRGMQKEMRVTLREVAIATDVRVTEMVGTAPDEQALQETVTGILAQVTGGVPIPGAEHLAESVARTAIQHLEASGGGQQPTASVLALRNGVYSAGAGTILLVEPKLESPILNETTWHALLGNVPQKLRLHWPTRTGVAPRAKLSDFNLFRLAGVNRIPANIMVILMTGFALLIGPLNYAVLRWKKQLVWMLATIPAVSLATTAAVLIVSTVINGFSLKARTRSVTVVDQSQNVATVFGRSNLYAGFAGSSGLRFSPDTAVYPVFRAEETVRGANLDWTRGQHYTSGYFRSRTQTQFQFAERRAERGRLKLTFPAQDATSASTAGQVANGFETGIDFVLVTNPSGELLVGDAVGPGASSDLRPATTADRERFRTLVAEFAPASAIPIPGTRGIFDPNTYGARYDDSSSNGFSAGQGSLEQTLTNAAALLEKPGTRLPPNHYWAILSRNPGLDLGLVVRTEAESRHFLFGHE